MVLSLGMAPLREGALTASETTAYGETQMIITGQDAIEYATRQNLTLNKYADPIEEARALTVEEAEEVAREDASLIWITVQPRHQPPPCALGWSPPH